MNEANGHTKRSDAPDIGTQNGGTLTLNAATNATTCSDCATTCNSNKSTSKDTTSQQNGGDQNQNASGSDVRQRRRSIGAPPDGGFGWVVVMSSFSISLLVDGVCFSFGIFFDQFRNEFNTTKAQTSWIGSVLNGTYLLIGPIVSALVNIYGGRKVAMGGAIMCSAALFVSTFSKSIGPLIFTYGFLAGFGFGLMYLPAIVMVGYYFERRRALATGIACCGSGIGAFCFAPFTEYLLQEYGWRGATWILSALVFHGFLFAIFFRPLPQADYSSSDNQSEVRRSRDLETGVTDIRMEGVEIRLGDDSDITTDVTLKEQNTKEEEKRALMDDQALKEFNTPKKTPISLELKKHIFDTLKNHEITPTYKTRSLTIQSCNDVSAENESENPLRLAMSQDSGFTRQWRHVKKIHEKQAEPTPAESSHNIQPLQRKDIFYSGSLWHLKEFKEVGSVDEFRREMIRKSSSTAGDTKPGTSDRKSFAQAFASIFDLTLLKSPTFLIYGMSCFLCMAGFFVPFIYLPTHVIDLGLDSQQAAFLISIIGITNTIGRVLVGFVSDQPWADCLIINNVALMIGGTATIFVPYLPNFIILSAYAAVFGTSIAVFVSLRSIIMVELMGLEKLTTAFGFVIMCQGMSAFIGAPAAGALSDASGNYNAAFYLAGITLTLSGVICIPLRRIAGWEQRKAEQRAVNQTNNNSSHGVDESGQEGQGGIFLHEIEIAANTTNSGASVDEATPMV